MKNLQNNLHLEGTLERKNKMMIGLSVEERLELAKEIDKVIKYLKEHKIFKDNHNESIINFNDEHFDVFRKDDNEYKVENRDDVKFVILNAEYICPVYTSTIVSLNLLDYSRKHRMVYLSRMSVGGNVKYGKINEYSAGLVKPHSLEEIDIETFDVYEYFNINKEEVEMA